MLWLGFVLAACAPAAQPTTVAPTVAPTETIAPATPTLTSTPARTASPTQTGTPTPTLPPLPPPNVTFKFDSGVPDSQRETIVAGLAMGRAYLGDSRPLTIIAYADLNAQMDEISRFFN